MDTLLKRILHIAVQPPVYILIIVIALFIIGKIISQSYSGTRIFSDEEINQNTAPNQSDSYPDW